MPLASMSNLTSICGTPRGAGGMPSRLNWPSSRLSRAIARSPWNTLTVTAVWLSAAVLKTCFFSVGNRGVAFDELGHDATHGFDAERQRRDVEQQHVLHFAGQHAALDRRADGHDFVRIDALVRLLAEHLLDEFLHLGDARRTADEHDFVDLAWAPAWRPSAPASTGPRQRSIRVIDQLLELGAGDVESASASGRWRRP